MSVNDFLLDFAIASLFIMIGQLIRAKVKVVQKFFVPASMIAGFIALALGSQGLNLSLIHIYCLRAALWLRFF